MIKSILTALSLAVAAYVPGSAIAQAKVPAVAAKGTSSAVPAKGRNYIELNPVQPVDAEGKIEVIEFFWYGCPHCYALEPLVDPWEKKLPKNAVLKRVPAVFNEQWGVAARVYYTLNALGQETRVRRALFDAINKEGLKVTDESDMAAWVAKHGIDAEKYKAAYRSFSVQTNLNRATQMTQNYRLSGVPTFTVQGRYAAGSEMNGEGQALLDVTSYLVAEVDKQLTKKPAAKAPEKPASTSPETKGKGR